MNPSVSLDSNPRVFPRSNFLQVLQAALESKSYRFARQAALNWLAVFPGDLQVQLFLSRAHAAEGKISQAQQVLEKVCRCDPEFQEAYEFLARLYERQNPEKLAQARAAALLLRDNPKPASQMPDWYAGHLAARQALREGNWQAAEQQLRQVMRAAPDFSLAAVDHLNAAWRSLEHSAVHQLATGYHKEWPECLQFSLRLAEVEIEIGNEAAAVELLHQCVGDDATGQVAQRLWNGDHRYQPLWPEGLEIFFDLPIPADVAFRLGWNRLGTGEIILPVEPTAPVLITPEAILTPQPEPRLSEPVNHQPKDETVKAVEETFARLAKQMKRPALGRSDGRFPVYVAFTTITGLDQQYGPQTRDIVLKEMQLITANVARRPGWNALVFCPDQAESTARWGLQPVEGLDPWKLKLALADLDQALAKKGQMIGALLIVGGPEIVPFHRLPNPTDDVDQDVPSDNPYATLDANYFVAEWPVGRLPGESGKDAGLLLGQLRSITRMHAKKAKSRVQWSALWQWLLEFLRQRAAGRALKGLGYSAAVWKESSTEVFKALDDNGELLVCPPESLQTMVVDRLLKSPLEYYNLHGMADAAEWYGQKDGNDISNTTDYPVALSPKLLIKNGNAPQVVYSEACYGAHIFGKNEDQALSLKFLSLGCRAVVGSTTIAYGSVTTPLIGADLLGFHFWKSLREGATAGEALLTAKMIVVKEMNQRQGFLDGEDQKTLISFVLYGDPMAGVDAYHTRDKAILRFKAQPKVKTVCARQSDPAQPLQVSQAVLKEVKAIVETYLPGLDEADFSVNERFEVRDSAPQPKGVESEKAPREEPTAGVVVTVTKTFQVSTRSGAGGQRTLRQYARVTLNEKGKMIKLAVSR